MALRIHIEQPVEEVISLMGVSHLTRLISFVDYKVVGRKKWVRKYARNKMM
jgi:hypothetical protein